MKFTAGQPACPVGCKYCFITEHELRRAVWNANPLMGVNKACTFLNVTPWIDTDPDEQARIKNFDFSLFTGDYAGFTAVTDPFWPKLDKWLWHWLDNASMYAKLTTCVTKWGISREVMKRLGQYPNFYLVLGMTGNWGIEKVPLKTHLRTLEMAKEFGVKCLPISHPYISGVSDLTFLPAIKQMGYDYFDVKGLRYCDANMGKWMPDASKRHYVGKETEEVLPEDGWRQRVSDAGLELLSPRNWYIRNAKPVPALHQDEAIRLTGEVFRLANIVSSDSTSAVFKAAVKRRM